MTLVPPKVGGLGGQNSVSKNFSDILSGTFKFLTPTPDSRLPTPDSRLPTPNSRLPIPRLPTPYCYGTASITRNLH
ncbi:MULTISPECIES: hypothetical protein [unclassified Moorena]|uniref:hypothetical protein n=1 Tax=unclassified Moorena TaxID=2683338 RepID=UPI0013FE75A7|nr:MULTISPECIES: hypothetical protein [unclassified Moorena]NEO14034.1 hypothetical protein [Moorena sp. SIO3E8]NEQ00509.1 hypothetical protein [Moorena sp. SIO3F7]